MMGTLSVLVVDDEPIARRRLIRLLKNFDTIIVVGEAGDVDEAVNKVALLKPDIVLLDILLPGGDGFDVIERLTPPLPQIVFVTAFDQHALRAFDKAAADYITKPVNPARLAKALFRAAEFSSLRNHTEQIGKLSTTVRSLREALDAPLEASAVIWIKDRNSMRRITLRDVAYVRAERDYVRLHLRIGGDFLYAQSMAAFEAELIPHGFLRVHRGTLVQIQDVSAVLRQKGGGLALKLTDQTILSVGRSYREAVRQAFLTSQLRP